MPELIYIMLIAVFVIPMMCTAENIHDNFEKKEEEVGCKF